MRIYEVWIDSATSSHSSLGPRILLAYLAKYRIACSHAEALYTPTIQNQGDVGGLAAPRFAAELKMSIYPLVLMAPPC